MNDDDNNMDDLGEDLVMAAVGELLNIASGVAELQGDDASADEIYTMCDIVAEYFGIERAVAVTTENEDGSYTTRFEHTEDDTPTRAPDDTHIPGSIRTSGKPKLRVIDKDTPLDLNPDADLDE